MEIAGGKSPFKDAVAVWHMANLDDSAGNNSALVVHGDVEIGVELKGAEREASIKRGGDGQAASFNGGYLSAGQGADGELNLKGKQMTMCIRLRDTSGDWNSPLFSKYGGDDEVSYHLYCVDGNSKPFYGMIGAESLLLLSTTCLAKRMAPGRYREPRPFWNLRGERSQFRSILMICSDGNAAIRCWARPGKA